jgi:hypothetical protein
LNQQPANNIMSHITTTPTWHKYCCIAEPYMCLRFSPFPFQVDYSLLWKCEAGGELRQILLLPDEKGCELDRKREGGLNEKFLL